METAGQNLTNGQKVNLSQEVQNLGEITLGFGWEPKNQSSITLHSFAILQDASGKGITLISPDSLKDAEDSVNHQGGRQNRNNEGDNQTIELNLSRVPKNIQRISFGLNVHEAANPQQRHVNSLGDVFMRCSDKTSGEEIFRYELSENASEGNAVIFGTLLRSGAEWEFQTNEEMRSGDLSQIFTSLN